MLTNLIAVISIAVLAQTPDGFAQKTIANAYDRAVPATCVVSYTANVSDPRTGQSARREASSFGLIVSPGGLVMAPGHMSYENSEATNITVAVGQGDDQVKYNATLLEKPYDVNVCFLQIESDQRLSLPSIRFHGGAQPRLGDPVLMIGVLGDSLDNARAVSTCLITAILEEPRTTYCLDSGIRYGFVGGPVFDLAGRAIGVVGFDLSTSEGGDLYTRAGEPLLYQADLFQKYIEAPPGESDEADAWLGVFGQPLTDDFAEYWGLKKEGGLIISTVVPGSPAEAAGLKSGDVIKEFNGVPIRAKLDPDVIGFTRLVRDTGIDKTVTVDFLRDGEPMAVDVTLLARPKLARDANEYVDEVLGLTVREITSDVRIVLNLAQDVNGVIIRRVRSGSTADLAGMRPGIIIMALGDHTVASLDDYSAAIESISKERPQEITAFCRAGAATGFFRLEPHWSAAATPAETVVDEK